MVQVIGCRLYGGELLPGLVVTYCKLDPEKKLTHWGRNKMAATLADDISNRNFSTENILIMITTSLNLFSQWSNLQ